MLITYINIKILQNNQRSDTGNVLNLSFITGEFIIILKVTTEFILRNINLLCYELTSGSEKEKKG